MYANFLLVAVVLALGSCGYQTARPIPPPKTAAAPAAAEPATPDWQVERRRIVAEQMVLTPEEERRFWPVYDRYQADLAAWAGRRDDLLGDLGTSFDDMTDADAKRLLWQRLALEEGRLKLFKSYIPEFERVLPFTKVFRYFQIDLRLRASVECRLIERIPLIE